MPSSPGDRERAVRLSDHAAAQLFAMIDGVTVQCLVRPLHARQPLVDRTIAPFVAQLDPADQSERAKMPAPALIPDSYRPEGGMNHP